MTREHHKIRLQHYDDIKSFESEICNLKTENENRLQKGETMKS